jgi:hypothetical protein
MSGVNKPKIIIRVDIVEYPPYSLFILGPDSETVEGFAPEFAWIWKVTLSKLIDNDAKTKTKWRRPSYR